MLPKQCLVYIEDVRDVCPDAFHLLTRCTESDLRKSAQLIVNEKHPLEKEAIRRFEENLTQRDITKPIFRFTLSYKTNSKGPAVVSAVKMSGQAALTAIADKEELVLKSMDIRDIFDGVWHDEVIGGTTHCQTNCVQVLKKYYPHLFNKVNKKQPMEPPSYISYLDASELLRSSLNNCVKLLRTKTGFNLDIFKQHAETYYQTSIMLFGSSGLTPYKLKLLIIPRLIESGHIKFTWSHLCESMEKSNHHAHRDFHAKTMKGGGNVNNQDPMFLEPFFSFAKFLKCSGKGSHSKTLSVVYDLLAIDQNAPVADHFYICQIPPPIPVIDVHQKRDRSDLLAGMRFFIVGSFGKTDAADEGAKCTPTMTPQEVVANWIKELGGYILTKGKAETLLYGHARTPNCFVLVKDDTDLKHATSVDPSIVLEEIESARESESGNESESGKRIKKPRIRIRPKKLTESALLCRKFSEGDFTFLPVAYLTAVRSSSKDLSVRSFVVDPYTFKLQPGPHLKKLQMCDIKPLLMAQCTKTKDECREKSAIGALRCHRKKEKAANDVVVDSESESTR